MERDSSSGQRPLMKQTATKQPNTPSAHRRCVLNYCRVVFRVFSFYPYLRVVAVLGFRGVGACCLFAHWLICNCQENLPSPFDLSRTDSVKSKLKRATFLCDIMHFCSYHPTIESTFNTTLTAKRGQVVLDIIDTAGMVRADRVRRLSGPCQCLTNWHL